MAYNIKRLLLVCLIVAIDAFIAISLISYSSTDKTIIYDCTQEAVVSNICGIWGAQIAAFLLYFWGFSAFLLVPMLLVISSIIIGYCKLENNFDRYFAFILIIFVSAVLAHIEGVEFFEGIYPGGFIGSSLALFIFYIGAKDYAVLFLFMLSWALLIIIMRFSLLHYISPIFQKLRAMKSIFHYFNFKQWQNSKNT